MYDQVGAYLLNHVENGKSVTNIEFVMLETAAGIPEPFQVPTRIAVRSEEVAAHVVINPVHSPSKTVEIDHAFRSDQTR